MDDLADGFQFYEAQQMGLGAFFLDSLFSDIDSRQLYAGIHRRVFGYYRLLAKRFPYTVYYNVDGNIVSVRAVLDCRRNPKKHRGKLG